MKRRCKSRRLAPLLRHHVSPSHCGSSVLNWAGVVPYGIVYFEKIRVFKAGKSFSAFGWSNKPLNTTAWDNEIGHVFYFVGF